MAITEMLLALFNELKNSRVWIIWFICIIILYVTFFSVTYDIPYINLLLFLSVISFVALLHNSMKTVKPADKWICLGVAFSVALLTWINISYESYYQGTRSAAYRETQTLYRQIQGILHLDISEEAKKEAVHAIFSNLKTNARTHVILKKDGEILFEKPYDTDKNGVSAAKGYIVEHIGDSAPIHDRNESKFVPFKTIYAGNSEYDFIYDYANQPDLAPGIIKAATFSITEDPTGDHFMSKRNYERSMNFMVPFLLVYLSLMGAIYLFAKKTQLTNQLKETNNQLEEANNQLKMAIEDLHIFELTYKRIQHDYESVINDGKNMLQVIESTWENDKKTAAKQSRHDALNKIQALRSTPIEAITDLNNNGQMDRIEALKEFLRAESEQYNEDLIADMYDFVFEPWILKIKAILGGLDRTLNVTPSWCSASEILENIQPGIAIPSNLYNSRIRRMNFQMTISENILPKRKYNIILDKLMSVIMNLIGNSLKAIQEYNTRTQERRIGYIYLNIYESDEMNGSLCFEVADNGGGFDDDIKDRIYKEPIRSSRENDKRKYGEGTAYIRYFVRLMRGKIEAENQINESGETGAITRIFLPHKDESE